MRRLLLILKLLGSLLLLTIILLLAVRIYGNTHRSPEIDLSSLLEGTIPPQAENLKPFLDDVELPVTLTEKNVVMSINTKPCVADGTADWMIRNPVANPYVIAVEVVSETGERLYSSGSIPPGSILERDTIHTELLDPAAREVKAIAYVLAYDNLRYLYVGSFTVELHISTAQEGSTA